MQARPRAAVAAAVTAHEVGAADEARRRSASAACLESWELIVRCSVPRQQRKLTPRPMLLPLPQAPPSRQGLRIAHDSNNAQQLACSKKQVGSLIQCSHSIAFAASKGEAAQCSATQVEASK